jgi:hypothetical protein
MVVGMDKPAQINEAIVAAERRIRRQQLRVEQQRPRGRARIASAGSVVTPVNDQFDAELTDRIGLTEHRLVRLWAMRQRMGIEGEDTIRINRQMQALGRIKAQVDWQPIEALLQPMRSAPTGRPAYPPLVQLKALLLQHLHGLLSAPALQPALPFFLDGKGTACPIATRKKPWRLARKPWSLACPVNRVDG